MTVRKVEKIVERESVMKNNAVRLSIFLCLILVLVGCSRNTDYVQPEQPHLYWKDIDVEVTDIDKEHWFATTHWYRVTISVRSEEYDLEESMEISGSGAFGCPKEWNYEVGNIVKAELYSWKMDSTGEIVRREIHSLK